MYDESGFLLLLRVLMAILMFSMEMEIGEEKKKQRWQISKMYGNAIQHQDDM